MKAMRTEFFKLAEQYAECVATDRKGSEFTFSEQGLLLFALEICEKVEAMDNALVEMLKS